MDANLNQLLKWAFNSQNPRPFFLDSVANILGYFIHLEVHKISCKMKDDNDIEPIRLFFLNGKGFKILYGISFIAKNPEVAFYNKELALLLIDILLIFLKLIKIEAIDNQVVEENCENIRSCFCLLTDIDFKNDQFLNSVKLKNMIKGGKFKKFQNKSTVRSSNSSATDSDESDSVLHKFNDDNNDLELRKSFVKMKSFNEHEIKTSFEIESQIKSEIENKIIVASQEKGDKIVKDRTNQDSQNKMVFINSTDAKFLLDCEVDHFEDVQDFWTNMQATSSFLSYVIISIIKENIIQEQLSIGSQNSLNCISYPHVSFAVIETLSFSLNLFSKETFLKYCSRNVFNQLIKLLFTASCSLVQYKEGLITLENRQTLNKLIVIANLYYEMDNHFFIDIVLGIIYLLACTAQSLTWTQGFPVIIVMISTFFATQNGQLILNSLNFDLEQNLYKIVSALSLLMCSLQRTKMLFAHHESCSFKKHTRCNLRTFLFHHHNILGQEFSSTKPSCCISSVTSIFLDILPLLKSESHALLIMNQFSNNSFCCCFNIHYAFESFLSLAQRFQKLEICVSILTLIEDISQIFDSKLNCCKQQLSKKHTINLHSTESTDEINSGECQIVSLYESLLRSEGPIRNLIAKHLTLLIKNEHQPLWDCLSQNLMLPLFLPSSFNPASNKEDIKLSLTLLCQALYKNNVSKTFLSFNGLTQLLPFLKDSALSNIAHQALEILIDSEVKTLVCQNDSNLSSTLSVFFEILNLSTLNVISDFDKILVSKPDPSLNESFNFYSNSNQAFLIKKSQEINCDNIISLFYVNNLWTIHSKLFRTSNDYISKIKSSFPQIVTSSYQLFKSSLFILFDQQALNHIFYIPNEKKGFSFFEIIRLLELIIPTLSCMTPFSVDSNKIMDQDILKLLKEKILQIKNFPSVCQEEYLKIIIKMLINASLQFVQSTEDSLNEYFKLLSNSSKFKTCDTLTKLSISSSNDSDQSQSEAAYEADDECCDAYYFDSKPASSHSYFKTHIICYKSFCTLAIEILITVSSKKYSQPAIILTFNTLLEYCRESVINRNIFYQLNLPSLVLEGFSSILIQDSIDFRPIQIVLFDFFLELCSKQMSGKELKLFLTFFKANPAPIELLIQVFSNLINAECKDHSPKPIYSIEFLSEQETETEKDLFLTESQTESWVNDLRTEASLIGVSSGWTDAAFALPLHQNKNMSLLNNKKFALTLWLSIQKPKAYFNLLSKNIPSQASNKFQFHIISLVFDTISLEIWLNIQKQMFQFRSVQISNGTYALISEVLGQCHISFSGHWHHVCFNFEEMKKHQLTNAPLIINYIIDGFKEETIAINHGCPKPTSRTCILAGSSSRFLFKTSFQFGNIILFKTRLSLSHCLYLYSLGPDFCDFTLCQIPETQTKLENLRLYKNSATNKSLLEEYSKLPNASYFAVLQETIFIIFKPTLFNYYLTYSTIPSDTFVIPIATSRFFTPKSSSNFADTLQVSHRPTIIFSKLKLVCNSSLFRALSEIGGIGVLIFFFAKMIEITSNEEIQAKSLEILLNVCEIHAEIFNNFIYEFNGFSMINLAIESTNCNVSKKLFQTYLFFCLSSSNVEQSIIICPISFAHLIMAWRAWHKNSDTISCLYSTIKSLISSKNPFREFNLMQMNRAHMNDTLLTMLQDTFLQIDETNLLAPLEVARALPEIIYTSIITSPFKISLLIDVVDCVLLLHQASNTYVSHSRSSFYFLFYSEWRAVGINSKKTKVQKSAQPVLNFEEWQGTFSEEKNCKFNICQQDIFNLAMAGLIEVIGKVISEASPLIMAKILGHIIKPEILLVLAHNEDDRVREEVMKCLIYCMKKGRGTEHISNFLNKFGLHLLSNQLHQHQTTTALIHLSFTLLWDIEYDSLILNECIPSANMLKLEPDQWSYFVVLFSLLPGSVINKSLCHSALAALQKYFQVMPNPCFLYKYLFENGIIECLSKILIEWEKVKQDPSFVSDSYETNLIVEDVFKLFHTISRSFFISNGSQFTTSYFQIVELLSTFERHSQNDLNLWFQESIIITFEAALECVESYVASLLKSKEVKSKLIEDLTFPTSNIILTLPESIYNSIRISAESSYNDEVFKENNENLSTSEITIRFQKFIQKTVDYLTCKENKTFLFEREKFFFRSLLYLMFQIIEINKKSSNKKRKASWSLLIGSSKEVIKENFFRIILYLLSPFQNYSERLFAYTLIMKNVEKFGIFFKFDLRFTELIEAFFKDLEFSSEDKETKNSISQFLSHLKSKFNSSRRSNDLYKNIISDWFAKLDQENNFSQYSNIDEANFTRLDNLFQKIAESAMNITRDAVEYQNHERKQFINHLKMSSSERYSIRKSWKGLIEMFTHEKSVWYYPESFPQSWELDPTEGPQRIRRRLRRCNLEILEKFFQPEQKKIKSLEMTTNLAYIFQKDIHESDFSALIDRLHTNERILYTTTCVIVAPNCEYAGEILIGDTCIYFVGEQKVSVFSSSVFTELWTFNDIKQINKCRYQLQNNAVEMFFINGLSYLISFETKLACEDFLKILMQRNLPNLKEDKSLIAAIQLWREGLLTNFEYLTYLNKISGRSFNDLMQYPVFPFILADYENETINLKSPQSFRNLSKPVAIQRKDREKYFINQYNYLKDEHERASSLGDALLPTTGPYHYGSHYSNSGTVLHFLVRLPPFTQMFLNYQDNSFDLPDRTFHSLATSWRLASGDSTTDFKELTPEFFFLPEFLINSEKFNFGKRQNGEVVDNVKLPPWCKNDARLFVLIHRQALESDYISQNLNKWIDLIFGYKQTGKAAIEAINVFHPATYFGFDVSKFEDPLKSKAIQTMIKTFGQMPKQLFTTAHPTILLDKKTDLPKSITSGPNQVIGLKWGNYVGSPSEPVPFIIFRKKNLIQIESFLSLVTNDVFGLEKNTCSLLTYSQQKGGTLFNAVFVTFHAIISWNHFDNVIRIKYNKNSPAIPLVSGSFILDKVTQCATTPGRNTMLVGYKSGSIAVYTLSEPIKTKTKLKKSKNWFHGHHGPVSCISISKEFNVAVSGGEDGACILWDLNKMCYIRTVTEHKEKVITLAISSTLGDIASLSESNKISLLRVNTINGYFVGELSSQEPITAICYSSAPEGISINSIVTGHSNGVIKFWCSWDLSPIRELKDEKFTAPIRCITFTFDNQQLYAANDEETVIVWGKGNNRKNVLIPLF